jgi:hypothetical protein
MRVSSGNPSLLGLYLGVNGLHLGSGIPDPSPRVWRGAQYHPLSRVQFGPNQSNLVVSVLGASFRRRAPVPTYMK